MAIEFYRKLPVPKTLKEMYPLSDNIIEAKAKQDALIKDVFTGESDKLVLVIGPCSADNEDAVLDYVSRLRDVQEKVSDKLVLIPRIYTNKPRTTGDGYKGLLHQPDPESAPDLFEGIVATRRLHTRAIEVSGLGTADEMLYPENWWYLSDVLSYCAVGARSVEDQQHRLVASCLDVPMGMKNPTSGDLKIMLNAIHAAQNGHRFIFRGWDVQSSGNPLTHVIMRGEVNKHGNNIPNYHYEDLEFLSTLYMNGDYKNPAVIVDTNHANSGKKYMEQIRIAREVLLNRQLSPVIHKMVKGFMIESYIESGSQKIGEGVYGKSITDPCLGWNATEDLILEIAETC